MSTNDLNDEQRLSRFLHSLGMPANLIGYVYIKEAVLLSLESDKRTRMTALYEAVANKHKTSVSNVERSMRHAVSVVFGRGNIAYVNEVFGYTISQDKGKATNSEFISMAVEIIKLKE